MKIMIQDTVMAISNFQALEHRTNPSLPLSPGWGVVPSSIARDPYPFIFSFFSPSLLSRGVNVTTRQIS